MASSYSRGIDPGAIKMVEPAASGDPVDPVERVPKRVPKRADGAFVRRTWAA
jgi:hypothetical protein